MERGKNQLCYNALMTQIVPTQTRLDQAIELVSQLSLDEIKQLFQHVPALKHRFVEDEKPKRKRQFGSARGLIAMADDFDEPLADFQEYMI